MAVRQQELNNVMVGRIQEIKVQHTGSESIWLSKIKNGNISATEEVKQEVFELIDGQELISEFGRKVVVELVFDELVEADIAKISNADYVWVATESGGDGSGRYLEVSGSDQCLAYVDGLRTHLTVEKSVATGLPYTIGSR